MRRRPLPVLTLGTLAVASINAWNRLSVSVRLVPGTIPTLPKAQQSEA